MEPETTTPHGPANYLAITVMDFAVLTELRLRTPTRQGRRMRSIFAGAATISVQADGGGIKAMENAPPTHFVLPVATMRQLTEIVMEVPTEVGEPMLDILERSMEIHVSPGNEAAADDVDRPG